MTLRTNKERRMLLYRRAFELKRKVLKRQVAAASAMTAALGVCLCLLLLSAGGMNPVSAGSGYTGASLLSDDIGGYVLVGVIAFMTGVIISAAIQLYRRRKHNR